MTGPRFLGLRGTITLRIIGACPEEFLMRLVNSGVRFRNYRKEDELTAYLVIPAEKLSTARAAANNILIRFCRMFVHPPSLCTLKYKEFYSLFLLKKGTNTSHFCHIFRTLAFLCHLCYTVKNGYFLEISRVWRIFLCKKQVFSTPTPKISILIPFIIALLSPTNPIKNGI